MQLVELDSRMPDERSLQRLLEACGRFNFVLYRLAEPELGDKAFVRELGQQLGLQRIDGNLCSDEDNISSIQVMQTGRQTGYIPYTDRQLTWHTDGYYNDPQRTIRAMVLHCVRPAASGGENLMLDHEMAYLQLRETESRFIQALAQLDVLTIPPNIENGKQIRPAQSGPVFSLDTSSGCLHMRYSARTRNIEWKQDGLTQEALACMAELLTTNNPYVITYRMQAGEGIIANNVLHNRTAFTDAEAAEQKRLLYRARYYDRVKPLESPNDLLE
jgi:alpha-ketoglutarate-dependent taurine dioxygenase